MTPPRHAGPHYRVEAADPSAHLYQVTLTIPQPQAPQRLSLPVWIPGSYLVREFSRHLQRVTAHREDRTLDCVEVIAHEISDGLITHSYHRPDAYAIDAFFE